MNPIDKRVVSSSAPVTLLQFMQLYVFASVFIMHVCFYAYTLISTGRPPKLVGCLSTSIDVVGITNTRVHPCLSVG